MSIALLPLALAAARACAPDPAGIVPAGAVATIRDGERAWAESIARDEAAFLRRHTAPGFVAVFDGAVIGRASLIASAARRRPGAASNRLTGLRVHPAAAAAVAEGTEIWTEHGQRRLIIWSDLWVRCGGRWRIATSTAAGTPAP